MIGRSCEHQIIQRPRQKASSNPRTQGLQSMAYPLETNRRTRQARPPPLHQLQQQQRPPCFFLRLLMAAGRLPVMGNAVDQQSAGENVCPSNHVMRGAASGGSSRLSRNLSLLLPLARFCCSERERRSFFFADRLIAWLPTLSYCHIDPPCRFVGGLDRQLAFACSGRFTSHWSVAATQPSS